MSIETEQYLRLKNKIYSNLSTKTFSINAWEKITEIPQEICLLQDLEQLHVYKNKFVKVYPKALADLPKLRYISLRFNNLKQLPKVLVHLSILEVLILSNNRFASSTQWELLPQIKNLKKLDVSFSLQNISVLPKAIGQIVSLQELNIAGNKLTALPKELAALKHLECLYCEINNFETFPSVVTQLPALKTLRIPARALQNLPDEVLQLQYIEEVQFTAKNNKNTPYIYHFERLMKNIKTYNFDHDTQLLLLKVIRGSLAIAELTIQQLGIVLNSSITQFTNLALIDLEERILKNQLGTFRWPKANDKIAIKGKIKGKVSELKSRLQDNQIKTGVKINQSISHILIGSDPALPENFWESNQKIVITEQLLVAHLNEIEKPYLLHQPEEENLHQIQSLLMSEQSENILLALELIKGGGFPMELLTDLFLIYKFTRTQKIKRIIHQIVGQYAPLEFVNLLKSRKSLESILSETTRRKNLEFYCQSGYLDSKKIAFYLLKKERSGYLFALFNLSTVDKIAYFKQALQNGYLYLSNLDIKTLPDDLHAIEGLTHLDISYNKFEDLPPQLFQCKDLKNIYIRGLFNIHRNPDNLWKIPNLENIYIGYKNQWLNAPITRREWTVNGKTILSQ